MYNSNQLGIYLTFLYSNTVLINNNVFRNAVEKPQKPIVPINPVLSEKNRTATVDKRLKGKIQQKKQVKTSPKKASQSPKVANLSPPNNAQHMNKSPQFFM